MALQKAANFTIVSVGGVTVLVLGKGLIIPFVFALLLWYITKKTRGLLDKSNFINNKFPSWLKNLLTFTLMVSFIGGASKVISSNIQQLATSYQNYEKNAASLISQLNTRFDIDIVEFVLSNTGEIDFGLILSVVFNSISDMLSNTFMILIYAAFLFLEETHFALKLKNAFEGNSSYQRIDSILNQVDSSIGQYLGLKTLVSFITGFCSYIALLAIGIDSPIFWAFLIFILNYIPTIGSLVGTLFPAIFCLLQFGDFQSGILVISIVGAIQIIVGNIVEPKLMGNSMNISPLVTILSLSLWGAIWGITGMILSVPITVVLIIFLSQFSATKSMAVLLSEKGKINERQ